jgi:hypothetical protein
VICMGTIPFRQRARSTNSGKKLVELNSRQQSRCHFLPCL